MHALDIQYYQQNTLIMGIIKQSSNNNNTKTEYYDTTRNGDNKWKNCKLIGSLLDTIKDINQWKILSIYAFRTPKNKSIKIKLRTCNAYVTSVFLYNSTLWALAEKNREGGREGGREGERERGRERETFFNP